MNKYRVLGLILMIAGISACSDEDDAMTDDSPATDDAGPGSSGSGGSAGRAGSSAAGSGAAGRGEAGRTAAGSSAAGNTAAGSGAAGTGEAGTGAAGSNEAGGGAAGSASSDPKNIVETAVAAGSFTKLAAALTTAKLVDALSAEGPFTVFAPNDAAFDAFEKANPGVLAGLSEAQLTDILKYHVISGAAVKAADLKNGQLAKTLLGSVVAVDLSGDKPKVGGATVSTADIAASNGVIHVIDTILLPPKDIIDTAIAAGSFGKLAAALTAAGLVDDLKGAGPFTVFAPTDAAFDKLAAVPGGDALVKVLLSHVVSGVAGPLDLKDKGVLTTLSGTPVLVDLSSGAKVGGSTLTTTNVVASNGVIHVIDTVIVPPATDIVATAIAAGGFTRLAAALTAAGLVDDLQAKGPFTVFAPTDAAFEALGSAPSGDALRDVLLYHVVNGAVGAGDLKAGPVDTLLTGEQVTIDLASGVKVNTSTVTTANIMTSNGVIHVIDKVLVPN
jgi:transforming growth factor-beta-induced protein